MKILEAKAVSEEFFSTLDEWYLPPSRMIRALTSASVEHSVVKQWSATIDKIARYGFFEACERDPEIERTFSANDELKEELEFLSAQEGLDGIEREPWFIPDVRNTFKRVCITQFVLKMNGLDPLTQVGAMTFGGRPSKVNDWRTYSDYALTDWATEKGKNAHMVGPVKTGKTNTSNLLMERFMSYRKFNVTSNIYTPEPPALYKYTPVLSDFLTQLIIEAKKGGRTIALFDEGGLYWNKIETIMRENIDLAKLVLCYGKLHANVFFISHFEEIVPTIIERTSVAMFKKLKVNSMYMNIRAGLQLAPATVVNVPETTIPYDPDQFQYFRIDLHVNNLFEFISRIDDPTKQWDSILEYIRVHAGEREEDELDPKEVARFLYRRNQDAPVRQIAAILKIPKSTVYDWVQDIERPSDRIKQRILRESDRASA